MFNFQILPTSNGVAEDKRVNLKKEVVEFEVEDYYEPPTPKRLCLSSRRDTTNTETQDSYYPMSVQSRLSLDDEYQPPSASSNSSTVKRRRGRPSKPVQTHIDPTVLVNLSPDKKKYKMMRFKNNEASRRSRKNRKQKDMEVDKECNRLAAQNKRLSAFHQKCNELYEESNNYIKTHVMKLR